MAFVLAGQRDNPPVTRKPKERGFHWAYECGDRFSEGRWMIVFVFEGLKECKDLGFGCALKKPSGQVQPVKHYMAFIKLNQPEELPITTRKKHE